MRKLRFLIVSHVLALCTMNVCAQEVDRQRLTIGQMFELAEQNNSRIKAHTTAVKEAQAGIQVAKSAYLPSVDASVSVSYNGDGMILNRDFGYFMKAEIPQFGNNFAIEVSQVIYAGGAISNGVKMQELQAQMALLSANHNRQEVRFLIVGNYLELCKMDNQLQVFESHIKQTEKVLADMRIRHQQGTSLHNDITRYELQLQNLQFTRTQLANGRQILNNQLTLALGLPQTTFIETEETPIGNLPERSSQAWEEEAQSSAFPIQMAGTVVRMNEYKKRLSHADRLPKVALFAMNNLTGPVTIEIPALDKNFNYWAVGLGVKYNIASLYKSNRKVKADKLAIRHANEEMQVAKEQTLLAIQAAHIKYREAFTQLDTKEKSVQLASQNYDVVNYRYENGLALITDLLDASAQKLDAQLQAVNARINILYNHYKLHYISGTL